MSMSAAMSTAGSGLMSSQSSLNVTANNIANVNTPGYKSQRVSFSDLLSQTISAGSGATATTGGINPLQYGMGTSVGSVETNMTQGTNSATGISTDVAISGNGLLVVQGGSQGEYQYTRAGNLSVDEAGNVTVGGKKICGWEKYTTDAKGNYVYDTNAKPEPLNINADTYNGNKMVLAAKASTKSSFSGILDSSKTTASGTALGNIGATPTSYDQSTSTQVYDAEGNISNVTIDMKKCYVDNATNTTSWYWQASSTDATVTPSSGYIEFDANGAIVSSDATNFNTKPTLSVKSKVGGTAANNITFDFSGLSTSANTTSKISSTKDGYASGERNSYSISADGTINGVYSNGQTQAIGKIALATFSNAAGLEKIGDNLYAASNNSGTAKIVSAKSGGAGSLVASSLESSNVDLSQEFSNMMIAQRAYQANSKVITTSDEMLQALMSMK